MRLPHCAIRAKERYGISIDWNDVLELNKRCFEGEGKVATRDNGTTEHMLVLAERVLWVAYRGPWAGAPQEYGAVLTILPPKVGSRRAFSDYHHMMQRKKQWKTKREG